MFVVFWGWLLGAALGCQELLVRVEDRLADEVGYAVAQRLLELAGGGGVYYSVRPSFDLEFLRMAVVSVCAAPAAAAAETPFELAHHHDRYVVAPADQNLPFAADDPAPPVMDLILQHVRIRYTDAEWSSDFHKDFVKSSTTTTTTSAPKYFRGPPAARD